MTIQGQEDTRQNGRGCLILSELQLNFSRGLILGRAYYHREFCVRDLGLNIWEGRVGVRCLCSEFYGVRYTALLGRGFVKRELNQVFLICPKCLSPSTTSRMKGTSFRPIFLK